MRRRYQDGGDVDTGIDTGDDSGGGALGVLGTSGTDPMTILLSQITQNMTSTPEAQEFARKILNGIMTQQGQNVSDTPVLGKMKAQAEDVRRALQVARSRLLAQNFNPGDALLAAAGAMGKPTKTGALGETASNVFEAIRDPLAKRREFERARDTGLTGLDLQEVGAETPALQAELSLEKIAQQQRARLAEYALKELGKQTGAGNTKSVNPEVQAAQALDRNYVKEHNEFVGGGAAQAMQGIAQLKDAYNKLTAKGHSDTTSGPYVGTVESIPYVGRGIQDIFFPGGSDVRNEIEQTVQRSLRPILGAQFTEREGTNLLNRVFNPRLEEWRNARRLNYLIVQMEEAYKNKKAQADWFQSHHTLYGFKGRTNYGVEDFVPPDSVGRGKDPKHPDLAEEEDLSPAAKASLGEDPTLFLDEAERQRYHSAQRHARGGRVRRRFQDGGPVMDNPDPQQDSSFLDSLAQTWKQSPASLLVDAGIGGAGGLAADTMLTALQRQIQIPKLGIRGRDANAERLVMKAATRGSKNPVAEANQIATDIKRANRLGVPMQLLDVDKPGLQAMAEKAITFGGEDADTALDALRAKVEGSRERVNAQINKGMKPYPAYDYGQQLQKNLQTKAEPIFQAAYAKAPGLPMDDTLNQIIDTPEGQKALQWAMRFYQNVPGRTIGKENPVSGLIQKPSLEFYDYIRKGFDTLIDKEERGSEGGTEFSNTVLRPLRKMFTDRLDAIGPPEYAQARQQYAGDLEVKDALKWGMNFDKLNPDQIADEAGKMSFYEKNAAKTGVAQRLYDMMDKSSSQSFNAAQKIAGSPRLLDQLKPLFDKPGEFANFKEALDMEADMFRTGRGLVDRGENLRLTTEKERQSPLEYAAKRAAGFRFSISPLGWFLRIVRDRPAMTQAESARILGILQRGDPKEMDAFARSAPKLLRSRVPRAMGVAAIGAGLKTLFGHDPAPDEDTAEAPAAATP
jgi:hypothetical protein